MTDETAPAPAAAAPLTPANLLAAAKTAFKGGIASGVVELLQDFDGATIGLVDAEAQDLDDALDLFAEDVETGMSFGDAWTKEWGAFVATEKSQLYADAVTAVKDVAAAADKAVAFFESAL